MGRLESLAVAVAASVTLPPLVAEAGIVGLEPIASGLTQPVYLTHAPGDASRLFIVERIGRIRIWTPEQGLLSTPYLSVNDTDFAGEGGLLSMTFHPEYSTPGANGYGKFYVYVTTDNGGDMSLGTISPFSSRVREYTVSGSNSNTANAAFTEIVSWVQPQANHNGGWIGFGPNDGYLYISSGDGGGGNDNDAGHTPEIGNAQDLSDNFLGKILRIDVDQQANGKNYAIPDSNPFFDPANPEDGKDDEIWAYGLRNPWRASFDRLTGDFWIGDVGQSRREEIDFQPASSTGGENYGWRLREGNTVPSQVGGPPPADYVPPVYDYTRGSGDLQGESVSGGYVYRGPDPELYGLYFFADSELRNVWTFDPSDPYGTVRNIEAELGANTAQVNRAVSFGEGFDGNLYLVDFDGAPDGQIFRILTDNVLSGDYNADGMVDEFDYEVWKRDFGLSASMAPTADGNGDGVIDTADYNVWRDHVGAVSRRPMMMTGAEASAVPEPHFAGLVATMALAMSSLRRRGVRAQGRGVIHLRKAADVYAWAISA